MFDVFVVVDPKKTYYCLDVDELLWGLRARIAMRAGISLDCWREYFIPDNDFPPEVAKRLEELIRDDSIYDNIEFFDGIEGIIRPELELGVKMRIVGNSTSKSEIIKKSEQLLAKVPGMKEENLDFRLVPLHQKVTKVLPEGTLIFADDLPWHIASSTAKINVLPRYSYNISAKAQAMMSKVPYQYFTSLREINQFIYDRTLQYLQTSN